MRSHLTPTIAVVLLLSITACNGRSNEEVLVSAAASLTDAFSEIEAVYEETHADVDVVLNFAGSSTLREQILEGAPVDVFAPANHATMDEIVQTDMHLGDPVVFATNLLQIAVAAGNPAGVTGLGDFADQGLLIGLCAPDVPCGDFARQILANAGIVAAIDTNEPDVRALLTKIEVGELDAGIVYATDILAVEGSVEGIDIPEALSVVAEYPIAVMADAPNPDGAAAFVDFVLSDEGHAVLDDYGFVSP
jgi:molybdate transport system substrate-binding protein